MPTLQRAREAMTDELAAAFADGDGGRAVAAARWLRDTGSSLVEIYEVLLGAALSAAPEYAHSSEELVQQHRVKELLCELAAQLGTTPHERSRGDVLVVVPGGWRHLLGVPVFTHLLHDAGWSVTTAPGLRLADVEPQLERLADPAALCLALHDPSCIPEAREVVSRVRERWPRLRVLVGGLARRQVPDLAGAVGGTPANTFRETLAALAEPVPLSPRELAVLSCVAAGMSNPDTAAHLGVAPATVKTHLDRVFAKLGTSDRTASVALALRKGWIS